VGSKSRKGRKSKFFSTRLQISVVILHAQIFNFVFKLPPNGGLGLKLCIVFYDTKI